MKTSKIVLGIVMIVLGIGLVVGVLAASGFKLSGLGTSNPVTKEYTLDDSFRKISVGVGTADVRLVPSGESTTRVVCREDEKIRHDVAVEGDTLRISVQDKRGWVDHLGFNMKKMEITVYLPQRAYESLLLVTDTGDVTVPGDFRFGTVEIRTDTGEVVCAALADGPMTVETDTGHVSLSGIDADTLKVSTDTGRISVETAAVKNGIDVESDTGDMKMKNITCAEFQAEEDTGDILLENVIVSGNMTVKGGTGDVRFEGSDAAQIKIRTSTGDVTGTLLTGKDFDTDTSTGKVSVPKTMGGRCEISTSTGDIRLEVSGQ